MKTKNRMSDDTPEPENPMLKQVGGSHYMYMANTTC